MPIIVNLDVVLAQRKMRLNDLADGVDITPQNLSVLKTGKAKAIRFSTLEAICKHLNCQPGEILEYRAEAETSNIQHPTSSEAFARRVLDVQCSMLVVGCFPCLNLHGLLVFRHDDLGVGFHAAQGLGVREALRFFAVDADDLLEVAGDFLDV